MSTPLCIRGDIGVYVVSRPMDKLMLEECCMRSCEPDEAYDIDINPDDIDVTDNVTVVWGIK